MNAQTRAWGKKVVTAIAGAAIFGTAFNVATPAFAADAAEAANAEVVAESEEKLEIAQDSAEQFIVYFWDDRSDLAEGDVVFTAEVDGVSYDLVKVRENALGGTILSIGEPVDREIAQAIVDLISSDESVEFAEIDQVAVTFGAAVNDPEFSHQWSLQGRNSIESAAVWNAIDGEGQVVAVLDSGIRQHADLQGSLVDGWDFVSNPNTSRDGDGRDNDPTDPGNWRTYDDCRGDSQRDSTWHGTQVAGVIAAGHNNGIGIAGAATNVKVQPIRVLSSCGGNTSDIAEAIVWASGGEVEGVPSNPTPASVINLSLGGVGSCDRTYQRAINTANANGATVVIASGNMGRAAADVSPGNCNNVVNVAATDINGKLTSYTNYGDKITVSAPGGDYATGPILSTSNAGKRTPEGDIISRFVGTSAAAPAVAAGIAMLKSVDPALTNEEIRDLITSTATPMSQADGGAGLFNMKAAYESLTGEDLDKKVETTTQSGIEVFTPVSGEPETTIIRVDTADSQKVVEQAENAAKLTGFAAFWQAIINFFRSIFGG